MAKTKSAVKAETTKPTKTTKSKTTAKNASGNYDAKAGLKEF
jgi:hypothetical protein